ncbi:hypothetical protein C8F01DRAFT_1151645 [Mycena amicta]|nr:hypothetical protein C8F01DRAFT_1151645 [Mycena amicta]
MPGRSALDVLPVELWEHVFLDLPPRASLLPAAIISSSLNAIAMRCHLWRHDLKLDSLLQPELQLTLHNLKALSLYFYREPLPTQKLEFVASWPTVPKELEAATERLEAVVKRMPQLRGLKISFGENIYHHSATFRRRFGSMFSVVAGHCPGPVLVCGSQMIFACEPEELGRDFFLLRCDDSAPCILPMCILDAELRLIQDDASPTASFSLLTLNTQNLSYFSMGDGTPPSLLHFSVTVLRHATFPNLRTLHLKHHVPLAVLESFLGNHPTLERLEYAVGADGNECTPAAYILHPFLVSLQLRLCPGGAHPHPLLSMLFDSANIRSFEFIVDAETSGDTLFASLKCLASRTCPTRFYTPSFQLILSFSAPLHGNGWAQPDALKIAKSLTSVCWLDITVPSFAAAREMTPWLAALPQFIYSAHFTVGKADRSWRYLASSSSAEAQHLVRKAERFSRRMRGETMNIGDVSCIVLAH